MRPKRVGDLMSAFEIVVDPNVRRRRGKRPLSGKRRAAALFRVWHGVRDLLEEAERLGDNELVHFLSVAQLLVEEKVTELDADMSAFKKMDSGLPN
jgi:hypothetical protein